MDFHELARRLKEYGTGIHQGESQVITEIKVKKDHIELHLGGGGYGTFLDALSEPGLRPRPVVTRRAARIGGFSDVGGVRRADDTR